MPAFVGQVGQANSARKQDKERHMEEVGKLHSDMEKMGSQADAARDSHRAEVQRLVRITLFSMPAPFLLLELAAAEHS